MTNRYKSPLRAVEFKNIFLTPSGIGLKNGLPIKETLYPQNKTRYLVHFYLYALYSFFTKPKFRLKAGAYVGIHSHWGRGYHHWLSEILAKILYLKGNLSKLTLILPEDYPGFAFQSLEAFSFKEVLTIPQGHSIQAKEIVLIENPYSGMFNPRDMEKIRSHCWDFYQCVPKPTLNLYISRDSVAFRRVANEAEVIEFLESRNFQIVHPEKLTFREQVLLFSQCANLISIHGAGLTNCMFMRPGTNLLELYRDLPKNGDGQNLCFKHLAEACNLNYSVQFFPEGQNRSKKANDADIVVDLTQLSDRLARMQDRTPREIL